MEQVEKPTPTPSRTLRVPQAGYDEKKYDYQSTLNGNVYFLTFNTIEDATAAYEKLREEKVPVRYHVYSLFVKFDDTLSTEKLQELVNDILKGTDKNITYTRVDESNHTGKVVVDRLEDCKSLLTHRDDTAVRLRFYRFDPKKAIKRLSAPGDGDKKGAIDGFTRVVYKKRPVARPRNTAKYEKRKNETV